MILKNIWIISTICVVLAQSFSAVQDACMPCNEPILRSFLSCLTAKLYENGFLSRTPEADANDVNEGIIIALTAFQSNRKMFNERVMLSILATEMRDMLQQDGSVTQSDVIAQSLSGFVRQCYISVTGETNEKFSNEFQVLLNTLLKNSPPAKNKLQFNGASRSSAVSNDFGGFNQNSNVLPGPTSNAYSNAETTNSATNSQQNLPPGYPIPANQQNELQNPIKSANKAENQYNYDPFNWQQMPSFPVSGEHAAAKPKVENFSDAPPNTNNAAIQSFPATQINENQNRNNEATGEASSMYWNNASPQWSAPLQQDLIPAQPAVFNQDGKESFNMKPPGNYPLSAIKLENAPLEEQSIGNNREVYNFPPAAMNQRQELTEGKDVYNTPKQMDSYSPEQYQDYNNQYQATTFDNTDSFESEKSTTTSPERTVQNPSPTSSKKQSKKQRKSLKKKAKKQKNIKTSLANEDNEESSNVRATDYSTSYINQQQGTSLEQNTYEPENGGNAETNYLTPYSTYSLPSTKAPKKNRSISQKKQGKSKKKQNISTVIPTQRVTNSDYAPNANISPKTRGFQGLSNLFQSKRKTLEFAKMIFVVLSKSELFCKVFNKDTSNITAQLQAFQIVSKGMKQCGYFDISDEIAQSCTDAVCSVKEGSSSQVYSQTIAKTIAMNFHKNHLVRDDSENQAKTVALAMIQFLPDERRMQDYNAQDQNQETSYAKSSYSEVNKYPFQTNAKKTPSENSEAKAENTNGLSVQNYNTKYTETQTEINGENIRSYSPEYYDGNDNNRNDEEAEDYDKSNYENYEQNEADKNYNKDNIRTIKIGPTEPTVDETEYECDETAENDEYTYYDLNDARGDSAASNRNREYDEESNYENYDEADRNIKNANAKSIAMANTDDGADYDSDEMAERDDYKYDNDGTQSDTPNNSNISTANEGKSYGNSYKNGGINEGNNGSNKNGDSGASSFNKQIPTNKSKQKSKKNKRQNKKSSKSSSTFQDYNETQRKNEEEMTEGKSDGSKNQIKEPRLAAAESAFGEKYSYESFLEELDELMEKANQAETTWIEEGESVVLLEELFALTELMLSNSGRQNN